MTLDNARQFQPNSDDDAPPLDIYSPDYEGWSADLPSGNFAPPPPTEFQPPRKSHDLVSVTINGEPRQIPPKFCCVLCARGAFELQVDHVLLYAGDPRLPGYILDIGDPDFEVAPDDAFVVVHLASLLDEDDGVTPPYRDAHDASCPFCSQQQTNNQDRDQGQDRAQDRENAASEPVDAFSPVLYDLVAGLDGMPTLVTRAEYARIVNLQFDLGLQTDQAGGDDQPGYKDEGGAGVEYDPDTDRDRDLNHACFECVRTDAETEQADQNAPAWQDAFYTPIPEGPRLSPYAKSDQAVDCPITLVYDPLGIASRPYPRAEPEPYDFDADAESTDAVITMPNNMRQCPDCHRGIQILESLVRQLDPTRSKNIEHETGAYFHDVLELACQDVHPCELPDDLCDLLDAPFDQEPPRPYASVIMYKARCTNHGCQSYRQPPPEIN